MKIAADASAIVAESVRERGRRIISHEALELFIAVPTWSEVEHEIRRRLDAMLEHGQISPARRESLCDETVRLLPENVTVVPETEYSEHEGVARARIPRDPNDWPTVALALALDAGIWTNDYDFFGCGVPVWITETLSPHLDTA